MGQSLLPQAVIEQESPSTSRVAPLPLAKTLEEFD